MKALQSQLPGVRHLRSERRRALQLLATSPRGATEDLLVLAHVGMAQRPSRPKGFGPAES
jgi:hypothetical protein